MRKVILALVIVASLTSCQGKAGSQDVNSTDSTAVAVDSTTIDSVATDSVAVDSVSAE